MKHNLDKRIKELELALNIVLLDMKIPFNEISKKLQTPISSTGVKKYWEYNNLEMEWEVRPVVKIKVNNKAS